MTRRRISLLLFLAIALALIMVGPALYRWAVEEQFSAALANAVIAAAKEPGRNVDLAKLPGPAWDRLFIFGPHTPAQSIDALLPRHARDANLELIAKSDAVNLLVLARNDTMVMSMLYPRWQGDFQVPPSGASFTRAEAVFRVRRAEGRLLLKRSGLR